MLGVHPHAYGVHAHGLGYADDSGMRAGVVYCSSNGANLHAHIASDGSRRWLTRGFLKAMFWYPFEEVNVPRITVTASASNLASIKFVQHLGFMREFVMERATENGEDLIGLRMFKEECKWLNL
jgi:RimJ/RimL family protein N-acetyltransferase